MSSINWLPNDVVNYEILSYLSDSDHIKFIRTNHVNYKLYNIKKYNQQYILGHIPPVTVIYNKITKLNIITLPYLPFNTSLLLLPIHLTSLTIDNNSFNTPIDELPITLTSLFIISFVFNQPINKLPTQLTSLTLFCPYFDQPVNELPSTLKSLTLKCHSFNQPVNELPQTLTLLILNCDMFNQLIDQLPNTLINLELYSYYYHFKQSITRLPPLLTSFNIYSDYNHKNISYPSTLTHINISYIYDLNIRSIILSLPSLTSIRINDETIK